MGLVRTCLAVRNKKKKKGGSDGYVGCLWEKMGGKRSPEFFIQWQIYNI
jgi:hypothetical protein